MLVINFTAAILVIDRHDRMLVIKYRLYTRVRADIDTEVLFYKDDIRYQERCNTKNETDHNHMIGRVLQIFEEIFRRNEIPHKVCSSYECQNRPYENGDNALDLVFRLAPVRLFLLVLDASSKLEQFCFDQITINDTKNGLRTEPSTKHSSAKHRNTEDTDKKYHQQKRHQIEFLHIELNKSKMQLHFIEAEQEEVISIYLDPWQYQRYNRGYNIDYIPFGSVVRLFDCFRFTHALAPSLFMVFIVL